MELLFLFGFWAIVGAVVGGIIGQRKGRHAEGVWFGLLLGPLGWLIVSLGEDYNRIKCTFCAELIMKEAKLCPHCGRENVVKTQPPTTPAQLKERAEAKQRAQAKQRQGMITFAATIVVTGAIILMALCLRDRSSNCVDPAVKSEMQRQSMVVPSYEDGNTVTREMKRNGMVVPQDDDGNAVQREIERLQQEEGKKQ